MNNPEFQPRNLLRAIVPGRRLGRSLELVGNTKLLIGKVLSGSLEKTYGLAERVAGLIYRTKLPSFLFVGRELLRHVPEVPGRSWEFLMMHDDVEFFKIDYS